ncbi:uncharacterized protein LOC123477088 isoform X5 [Daphnia magna]|uniref:uncharacterized protein LOC123477088 isoform X5 n=1 Tax=Daphnia magna TaxID=35525 RepID=UPI001E1BCA0C|nr:uncharacterized protein LOC123477088 isoform X5 [Daphnia magna]
MAGSNTSNGKLPKKMSCFICGNIYQDENRRVGLFHVPKKNFSSWKFVLPELLEKSRLCDIHFDKCDVLKGITVGKDFYPYDRWRLLPSAIPKHLLVKQSAAASRTQSRTPLKDIFSVNHTGNQPTNYFPPKKRNSKGSTSISQTPENKIAMDEDEEHSIVGCAIKKSNAPEKNSPKSNFIENDKDGMADFIFKKHTKKKCQIRLPTNCKTCQMEKTGQCSSCAIVELKQQVREKDKQLITAKCYRTRSETHLKCLKLKLKENRKKLNTCRQKLLRMKRYGQEIVETLGNLKEKITTLTANQLDEQIKFLSHGERVIINTFILKGKAELQATSGRSHSMKYDSGFLMQCLLLKLKSSSTYTHLKNNNILPLPSLSTLRRRLSSSECKYGFNELALQNMKQALENLQNWERWGSLMWDEVSLKKDLTWHATRLEWHGIVDFGEDIEAPIKNGIATHALVLMFRPYKGNWVQPFACFASENAASAIILHEVIVKAIVLLYNHSAIVKNVVCDGCSSNK